MARIERYEREGPARLGRALPTAACLDITGARWGLRSADAVLKLRSLHYSGDTEAYWAFHKAQERAAWNTDIRLEIDLSHG